MRRLAVYLPVLWALVPLLVWARPPVPAGVPAPSKHWTDHLEGVMFRRLVEAPGYSEGPTWRGDDLFFCCKQGLLRVGKDRKVRKYLELDPAGTLLRRPGPGEEGGLLVCDNKLPALLLVTQEGKVGVVAEHHGKEKLRSLNDLTVDRAGNIYWTDPKDSSQKDPKGKIYRVTPEGKVDLLAWDLAFPNGIEVDPENRYLYVIESQTAKILRYEVPPADKPLGRPIVFYALGGSGGDGCAFDKEGNLWVADFHRPETGKGRITILRPQGDQAKVLGHLEVPAQQVSNLTFGGAKDEEIFVTTGSPPGVYRAVVGVAGFPGHAGKAPKVQRWLDLKPLDTPVSRK
jgi:sugar lactone lactonase YvrE